MCVCYMYMYISRCLYILYIYSGARISAVTWRTVHGHIVIDAVRSKKSS